MAKPKLALIPSTVGGSVYSVLPSNGDGDFDFSRASAATRINAQGLIETVAVGDNRLNYPLLDGRVQTCPHLLLEPQRTNLIPYSEDFSNAAWAKTNSSITSNDIISPDGTLNASRLTDNATNGFHVLGYGNTFVSGQTYTATIFAKKGTASRVFIGAGNPATWGAKCYFDLDNGTVSLESIGNAIIEDYGNGWYRCTVVGTANANASTNVLFGLANYANDETYIGSGDYAYFWGAQLELGSYPTSYIPTSGSTTTRIAEVCNGSGNASTFNSEEGVLYAEISSLTQDNDSDMEISLNSGSSANRVSITFTTATNTLRTVVRVGGTNYSVFTKVLSDITAFNKIALKYKENDFALWVNGIELSINNSGITFPISTLNILDFQNGSGSGDFYGKTKQIAYFPEALTDSELECLTSWSSFNRMAIDLNYTIQ